MAYALDLPASAPATAQAAPQKSFFSRMMDAIQAAQMRRVRRELMLHAPFIHETALINEEFRKVRLADSAKLPVAG